MLVEFSLAAGTQAELHRAIADRSVPPVDDDPHSAQAAMTPVIAAHLPTGAQSTLSALAVQHAPAVIVRGLCAKDCACPTPYDGRCADPDVNRRAAALAGLLACADLRVLTACNENEGRSVRHVVPNPARAHELSSHGFARDLRTHVDNPTGRLPFEPPDGRPQMPEFLSFLGVRSDARVPTMLASLDRILERLSARDIDELTKPQFTIHPPDSNDPAPPLLETAILVHDCQLGWVSRFAAPSIELKSLSRAALSAIAHFEEASRAVALAIRLDGGDAILYSNLKWVHFRHAFEPDGRGWDRWLLKLYAAAVIRLVQPCDR